ncbi:MAG TPA: glycoside hydrolase family 3 C-terminal domain-containing protein [Bacteroidales bacterium]|nr:glycoside hydrolase family 3 C-terminal domain-containing protein [Bacteroidales bacterium]
MKKTCLFVLLLTVLCNISLLSQTNYRFPFQDPRLPIEERVHDLVSRMTLEEKVTQFFNHAEAIPRLDVPAYDWWNECLHGVARAGKATVFPQAIGLAATFDEDLMFRIATVISDEARAKHHNFVKNNVRSIYTGLTFWSPNINIFRDPRWGRGQETYGEDPYLTGRMAVNFIKGLQGDDPKYLKTVATAKHYAVHSGPEFTRHVDNIFINDRDLHETYLPAFKATVKEANVQSVMCAYNRFRDKPCCGSDLLLSNILRKEFGFTGYVVSDCGAISDFYTKTAHNLVETSAHAWGWSLASGTDLNCEMAQGFLVKNLDSAIYTGIINEKDMNTSLERLFRARFMLGMFDPDELVSYSKIPFSVVGSKEHLDLTQKAAEKSLVLLKNNGILPLRNIKKVALIGPNADNFAILIGNYNGVPVYPVTPLRALRNRLGAANVLYTPGCPIVPDVYTNLEVIGVDNFFHIENGKRVKGLKAEYYDNNAFKGSPKITRVDNNIDFYWYKSPVNNLVEDQYAVRWSGVLVPEKSGTYVFGGSVTLQVDGKTTGEKGVALEKGKQYSIKAEFSVAPYWWSNAIEPAATLTWAETTRDYRKEALAAAQKADVVIFCGGITANLEGEEMPLEIDGFSHGDRTHINLPNIQEDLLKDLHNTGKPVIYVNFSGSAIALNWESDNLPAIVQAFYPGEATGTALTRLLFGDFNPSGRLPVTFYKTVDELPDFRDYTMEGRTYRYFKGEPLWGFGFGLSYSIFTYKNLQVPASVTVGEDVTIAVEVTNTGTMDGEEVVQVYVADKEAGAPVPLRSLAAFERIFLKAGETKKIEISLKPEQFSLIDNNYNRVVEPGNFIISAGGYQPGTKSAVDGSVVQVEIELSGNTLLIKN